LHGRTTSGAPRRRRTTIVVVAIVLALHGLLIALLGRSTPDHRTHSAAPARVTLRLIAPPRAPVTAAAPSTPARATRSRPTAMAAPIPRLPTRSIPPDTAPTLTDPDQPAPTITRAAAADRPDAAASDAARPPSLLDSEATRRAIRASARTPSLGEQLARSREEPHRAGPNERLATDIREAGKGDCLKGEYAGAGMGLLSLPFLALATASGHCAK